LDRFSGECSEFSAKFTSEPARLQLELIWNLGKCDQWSLANARGLFPHLGVAIDRMHSRKIFSAIARQPRSPNRRTGKDRPARDGCQNFVSRYGLLEEAAARGSCVWA